MKELIQDGVNGLTFRPGDSTSLRRCLTRLIENRDLLPRLRQQIPAVKNIEEHTVEIDGFYQEIMA